MEKIVATAEQLRALLQSHATGDDEHFWAIALQVAAYSARKGHSQLAKDLRDLVDKARQKRTEPSRNVHVTPAPGDLAGLIAVSYPNVSLADMVLDPDVLQQLSDVVRQYRQRELLGSYGLSPKRKLLLVGPPGCGKTMSALAIANECGLPLMNIQLHALITKFMGETAAKLHLVFDAMVQTKGVYLFDEFDALGAHRGAGNDVGEIRRVLNSFLQFLERDDSGSIVIGATNFVTMLDLALFRRFDDVIEYKLPSKPMAKQLVQNRLAQFDLREIEWQQVSKQFSDLSHAEIARACEEAARDAVLKGTMRIDTEPLERSLQLRRKMGSRSGSGRQSAK